MKRATTSDQPQLVEAQCHRHSHSMVVDINDNTKHVPSANASSSSSSKAQVIHKQEASSSFMLPDLNLPVDEDLASISIHGLS
ncbi:uncharacterized protein G2W53_028433 [Senna tora]|uniref:Uncharacterized protein n=1 Tax=Senna tora TaxID=362788 RepID=A0A834T2B6_9FABA|nr:uncharacterized protein G2W53_028433 [Senna tora]